VSTKEDVRSIAGLTLTMALASVAIAMMVRSLPRPRASETWMSSVGWLNAPSAIPTVNHLQLIALGAAAACVLGTLAWRGLRRGRPSR
jgi:hypothetical protein